MLTIRKGREKVRVFTFMTCKRCGGVYAYINSQLKPHISDIFKDEKIFERDDRCPNCDAKLNFFDLTEDNYKTNTKTILFTTEDGKSRTLNDDEIFVYI